jgi:endonuclease/exonuclease/phosphatase family metal-dependent hydrolase
MLVMSWNLHNGGLDQAEKSDNRYWGQLAFIANLAPDIVCLQEARWWNSNGYRRLLAFEATTGLRAFLGHATSGIHTVVAVRTTSMTPIMHDVDSRIHHVHNKLMVTLPEHPAPLVIVSTHLSPYDGITRLQETATLLDLAHTSCIIAGDMHSAAPDDPPTNYTNTPQIERLHSLMLPTDNTLNQEPVNIEDRRALALLLHAGFTDTATTLDPTTGHDGTRPQRRQHRILVSPSMSPRLASGSYAVLDTEETRTLSYHLPIVIELWRASQPVV